MIVTEFMLQVCSIQVTENNSISLAQFDYTINFTVEYLEEIDSGKVALDMMPTKSAQES